MDQPLKRIPLTPEQFLQLQKQFSNIPVIDYDNQKKSGITGPVKLSDEQLKILLNQLQEKSIKSIKNNDDINSDKNNNNDNNDNNDINNQKNKDENIINNDIKNNLLNKEEAKILYETLLKEINPKSKISFNRQKKEKKHPAYFSNMISFICEKNLTMS